jgi:hypothetical protein
MSETRWKGNWWLPGSPDETRPGTLHYDEDQSLRLELIGGFNIDVRTPMADGSYGINFDGSFPVIHGVSGGELFTLLECHASHTSGGFTGANITEQTISAIKGLRGILVTDGDEEAFSSIELRLEYLLAWSSSTSISASIELGPEPRWTGKQTASSTPVEDRVATHDGLTITLRVPHSQFDIDTKHSGNLRSVTSREYGEIIVASEGLSSLNQLDQTAKALQDLLTLAAHGPAGVLRRSLWFESSPAHPAHGDWPHEVEVMGSMIYKPGSESRNDPYSGYLFTLNDVEFSELVPAWLAIHKQAWLPCSMLFGTQYLPAGYTGTRLFTVASVAEGLHRCLHDSIPLDDAVFKDGLKNVLKAVPGNENKPFRKLVHDQLRNHLTYGQRLRELTEIPDAEAVTALLPDVDLWIELLKNARNGAAHADHSQPGTKLNPHVTFWLSQVSYVLLCLVLMAEMKVPPEVQRRAVQTQEIMHAIGEYKRATAPAAV